MKPTISIVRSYVSGVLHAYQAIWNVPISERFPLGTQIFGDWADTEDEALKTLVRIIATHDDCALVLMDLVERDG